ncbi:MAG: hypothetical protein AB7G47_19955 [Mycolicibacterium sp.]|uniref:hypothetical protein n=1 Tax=Mycolicibacterium sp. TaxID=2320850 RepID=UPI003D0FF738
MSWTYESESPGHEEWHEGYFVPEFADGERGFGVSVGADDTQIPVEDLGDGTFRYRQAGEVAGWRICCDCYLHANEGPTKLWVSQQLWTRVASPIQLDPKTFRLYAPDESVTDPTFTDDAEDAAEKLWWREHIEELDAFGALNGSLSLTRAAAAAMDAAVLKARGVGLSWAKIGASLDMTPQAAHQRWSGVIDGNLPRSE